MAASLSRFSRDGALFLSVSKDNRIKIWETAYAEAEHLGAGYASLAWYQDGESDDASRSMGLIALGTARGTVVVWDLDEGIVLQTLGSDGQGHSAKVAGVCFNATGSSIFSCASEKHALEWDVKTGKIARRISIGKTGASSVSVNAQGTVLATATSKVTLWDLASAEKLMSFPGHEVPVESMQFSDDGRHLLTMSEDRMPHLWSCAPKKEGGASRRGQSQQPVMTFGLDGKPTAASLRTHKKGR
eukprot:g6601.t1